MTSRELLLILMIMVIVAFNWEGCAEATYITHQVQRGGLTIDGVNFSCQAMKTVTP